MRQNREITTRSYNNLLARIGEILQQARTRVIREINRTQVLAYWEIGREWEDVDALERMIEISKLEVH